MSELPYNPLKDFEFIPIPLVIDRRTDLKSISKRVYGYYLKCYGKDGEIFPTADAIANALGKSRKTINEGIKELKEKSLIYTKKKGVRNQVFFNELNKDGFPLSVTPGVSDSVTPGVIDSVTQGVTPPIIKDKGKNKIKEKSGATPDLAAPDFGLHPSLNSIWEKIPFKRYIKKTLVNDNLWNHGQPYVDFSLRISLTKNNPAAYFHAAMTHYLAAYLNSPEHGIAEFRLNLAGPLVRPAKNRIGTT